MKKLFLIAVLLGVSGIMVTKIITKKQAHRQVELRQTGIDTVVVGKKVDLRITPLLGCQHGDLDAVREDLMNDRKSKLLVSIEPIIRGDKGFEPVTKSISQSEFFKGTTVSLDLPKVDGSNHLGLFICKDNEGRGYCGDKSSINLTDLMDRYFFQETRIVNDLKAKDKMFYFQYFVFDKGVVHFLTKDNSLKSIASQIDRMTSSYTPAARRTVMNAKVKKKLLSLTSVPIDVFAGKNRTELILGMPGYDDEGCKPEVSKFRKQVRRVKTVNRLPANLRPALK